MPTIGQPLTILFAVTASMVASAGMSRAQAPNPYTARTLALPDHGKGTIAMDYIAYDARTNSVWVPAINIGSVYVVDVSTGNVHEIPVAQVPTHEGARNGVVTKDGAVYLAHSQLGQLAGLIVVSPVRTAAAAQ